ncbi:M20/M25/M40 family metallo-hydrolase [Aquicella lusitana]|uniref:Leucyl aminopeptidase n=1 Tax=Aquicella lusitana TaxID=254246 RepID=A0A370G5W1_9COXI|nr:M20/M25/M40 family metallo-hydrolase [Aquicella lusitana]RDI39211.1 leucyl aminopeptidase [Aquicella lusitana]VVC74070.1 Bacterial leucyl aminopeptidase [Aquicella lusitana]
MSRTGKIFFLSSVAIAITAIFPFTVKAQPTESKHVIVAPPCLIKNINTDYKILSSTKQLVLIETDAAGVQQLMATKHQHKSLCGGFMDVTQDWHMSNTKIRSSGKEAKSFLLNYETPHASIAQNQKAYSIQYSQQVNQLLTQINPQNMWNNLTQLTNTFQNRNANTDYGLQAANWIKAQVETMASETGHDDVTIYTVATGKYKQPSVVAKVGNGTGPGIVIGGHMDTIVFGSNTQPGADDDGSGTVTVLETARTVLFSGLHFKKPIYFIWYAAEEQGMIGSYNVVADFKSKNIPVEAVIQFDLTGFAYQNEPTMWLMDDYVNANLTSFLEQLITTYVKQPVKHSRCGYACSDHARWYNKGYATALPAEAAYENSNPSIHSTSDTMEKLSLNHMTDYAKLAVAFAVEMAEPVEKK